jgi:hypothetical protein
MNFRPGSNPATERVNPMAKANRVHSTPRRSASKIRVNKPAKGDEERKHSEAFSELESPMSDLFCMAKITREAALKITRGPENEIAVFAVSRLCDMIDDLHANYSADLAGKAVV